MISNDKDFLKIIKDYLFVYFEMKDMCEATYIMNFENRRDKSKNLVTKDIWMFLQWFNIQHCKTINSLMGKGECL